MRTKQAHRRAPVARVVNRFRALPVLRSYPTLYVSSAVKSRRYRDDLAPVRTFIMFVGHPRSGHSLVGSLLDAHPNVACRTSSTRPSTSRPGTDVTSS